MKKTYINPNIVVVKIQTMQMLAASKDMQSSGTTDQNLSREGSFWDDED